MRKTLAGALCAAVCAVSAGVGAQQAPAPAGRRYVAIGCLSREAPAPSTGASPFVLTDSRGDAAVVYRLEGDQEQLTFHVGHTIEVSGPLSVPPAGVTGPHAKALVMKVGSITYLSRTCAKP